MPGYCKGLPVEVRIGGAAFAREGSVATLSYAAPSLWNATVQNAEQSRLTIGAYTIVLRGESFRAGP